MNEAETRAEYIDPKLKARGWGEIEGSKILPGGVRGKPEIADYILVYKNQKLAVIEAKQESLPATEGVTQAKAYAQKLKIEYAYATNGREILEYFSPAVQLGMTATPKRTDNIDTYRYFGEPVHIYSLKEGINDGFLTPFKVLRINTTLDEYIYTSDDQVIEGEVEEGRIYEEEDFNKIIEIKEREATRVQIFLGLIDQKEKTIPTILTTSQKLSTGVDARNIRNIVLMRPINSMVEFKQIIGRGTRLFDGKEYFTILDFVDAYKHFFDPEWDGEPIANITENIEEDKIPEKSDLFDVLAYVSFAIPPITREERARVTKGEIFKGLDEKQKEFLSFVLSKYVDVGVEELDEEKLPDLLNLKYHAVSDAVKTLGDVRNIRLLFFDFQKKLYARGKLTLALNN